MRKQTMMTYDPERAEWGVRLNGNWYGMHCGEGFGLRIGTTVVGCRLEADSNWYVELPDATRFILHPRTVYTVTVDA
jgi:hypothetical protein